jgi:hypothetical protein
MFSKSNAIIRSLLNAKSNSPDFDATMDTVFLACQFRESILKEEVTAIVGLIDNIPENYRKRLVDALLFSNTQAPALDKKIFGEFQSIDLGKADELTWDTEMNYLVVDGVPLQIPQSLRAIDSILEMKCVGLTAEDISLIRTYTSENIGPWNFYGLVDDFIKTGNQIWAINKEKQKITPIISQITPIEFINSHQEQIENLSVEGQITLAYQLYENSYLLTNNNRITIEQSSIHPAVIVMREVFNTTEGITYLSRPQSSQEFLNSFPPECFEFGIEQEGLYQELANFINHNQGHWNNIGMIRRFFVNEHGAVQYELFDGKQMIVPLSFPFGEFMKSFVDDNPSLDPTGKRIIEKYIDSGKLKIYRGQVKSVYGDSQLGVYIVGHYDEIIFAGFDRWDNPKEFISNNPFLKSRSKQTLLDHIEKNPDSPEWSSQGYIKDILESDKGVVLIRYDDNRKLIPYLDTLS